MYNKINETYVHILYMWYISIPQSQSYVHTKNMVSVLSGWLAEFAFSLPSKNIPHDTSSFRLNQIWLTDLFDWRAVQ